MELILMLLPVVLALVAVGVVIWARKQSKAQALKSGGGGGPKEQA